MIDEGRSVSTCIGCGRGRAPGSGRCGIGLVVFSSLLSLLILPSRAVAADEAVDPFDRPGPYVTVAGSYAYNFFDQEIEDYLEDELGEQGNVDIDDSGGLNARLGYRAASWFAAELAYEWIDRYDVEIGGELGPGGSALSGRLYDIEGHTLTVNTRWMRQIGVPSPARSKRRTTTSRSRTAVAPRSPAASGSASTSI